MLETRFSETGNMAKKRAVLIDDSKLARFALTKLLKEQGLKVEAFESAEEGLAYLETGSAHAVFMDHLMPGMDGLEATRAIRSNPRTADIPVVLCTSNDSDEHRESAIAAGAIDLLPKPVDPGLLSGILGEIDAAVAAATPAAAGLSAEEIEALVENRARALIESELRHLVAETVEEQLAGFRREVEAVRAQTAALSQVPPVDEESLLETAEANAARIAREVIEAQPPAAPDAALTTLEQRLTDLESRIGELSAATQPEFDQSAVVAEAGEAARASAERMVREILADQPAPAPVDPEAVEQRLDTLSETMTEMANDFQVRIAQSRDAAAEEARRLLDQRLEERQTAADETLARVSERLAALEAAATGTGEAQEDQAPAGESAPEGMLSVLEGKLKRYAFGAAAAGVLAAVALRFVGG